MCIEISLHALPIVVFNQEMSQEMCEPTDTSMMDDIINIIDSASSHQQQLTELVQSLDACKKQVNESAENSRKIVTDHFTSLRAKVVRTLDERLESLLIDIDTAKSTALNPLLQCEDLIRNNIDDAASLIDQGGKLLQGNAEGDHPAAILKYKAHHECSSLNVLPAVPSLNEVAYISVQLRPSCKEEVLERLSEEGEVLSHSPVTITDIQPCPGGLHISWEEREDESSMDIGEFCLQYSLGTPANMRNATFHSAYVGPNTTYTLKGLRQGVPYMFRVSCRGEGATDWATWSIPWPASTTLPHYQWSSGVAGYSLINEARTLVREGEIGSYPPLLFSSTDSYETGETISFRVLDDNDIGVVYIDGNEMKNHLPSLTKGSTLTFHTDYLSNGKIRVSADIDDKQVTFDWTIDPLTPTLANGGFMLNLSQEKRSKMMYFAACFTKEDWRIAVE